MAKKMKLFLQTQMMIITQWILQLKWHMEKGKKSSHSKNGFETSKCNRVICKVRQTQHHNPEFGHTQGEIQK